MPAIDDLKQKTDDQLQQQLGAWVYLTVLNATGVSGLDE